MTAHMQITPENLQRLRTALRELQQVLDDIDAEQEAEQATQAIQVNYPVLKDVIGEFMDSGGKATYLDDEEKPRG